MSRARRDRSVGRFALSLTTFVGIAVGVPLLLVAVSQRRFGSANPLAGATAPWDWSGEQVGDGLREPLDDDSVLDLLIRVSLVAVWVAVAVIVVVTVAEIVHIVRHRGIPQPSIRGLGWAQHIGRFVAVGLVVMIPFTGSRASIALDTPIAAWAETDGSTTGGSDAALTHRAVGAAERAPADATVDHMHEHVVGAGESVYSIASAIAGGDDQRIMDVADAIIDANLGAEMGGGRRFTNPAYIEVGWVLLVPGPNGARPTPTVAGTDLTTTPPRGAGDGSSPAASPEAAADGTHVVQPGDTLWDIAAAHLGDAAAWSAIWDLNAGRDMGDDRTFDDPHLILTGWRLDLPERVAETASEPVETETDIEHEPGVIEPLTVEDDPVSDLDGPVDADPDDAHPMSDPADGPATEPEPTAPRRAAPSIPAVSVTPPASSTTPIPTPATTPATTPVTTPAAAPAGTTSSPISTTTTSTVVPSRVTGSGGDAELGGEAPAAPRPIRLEHAALVAAGLLALIGVRRRRRLRAARPRSRVPEPLERHVATERRLRNVDAGERAARIDVGCRAIAHALVGTGAQIGWVTASADGGLSVRLTAPAMLPPPWVNVLDVTGPDSGCEWSLGAEVPIELLSDDARQVGDPCLALVQVGMSGSDDVLVDLEAAGVLAVEAGAAETDDVITAIAAALASSLHAETAHLVGASLAPEATLQHRNAHRVDGTDAALELAAALVGTTATQERTSFELRSLRTGGEAWEPAIVLLTTHDDLVGDAVAAALPDPGHGVALVAPATSAPARGSAAARLVATAAGWKLAAFGGSLGLTPLGVSPSELTELVDVVDAASEPLLSLEDLRWSSDVRVHASHDGADRDRIDSSDRHPVDGEGAEHDGAPFDPMPHEIVVGLMGPVTVTDRHGMPGSFERSKTVELIAWLATHRARSTRTGARTALWELDVRDATFANVVSEARRALGRLVPPPENDEWVGRTLSESLPLHDAVVTDAQLVQERVDHARLQPPEQAADTLRPAVELVRDLPFSGTNYLWPDAEGITSNLVLLAMTACTEFAGHALSLDDTEGVFWATGQGLRVLPGHEELIGLRMRAHARSGDLAGVRLEWEAYERVIVADAWSDGEPAPKLVDLRHALLSPGTAD